jgi:hypothetical protein
MNCKAGDKSDRSRSSSNKVRNTWSYTSTPPFVLMVWYLIRHKDNFTFSLYNFNKKIKIRQYQKKYMKLVSFRWKLPQPFSHIKRGVIP